MCCYQFLSSYHKSTERLSDQGGDELEEANLPGEEQLLAVSNDDWLGDEVIPGSIKLINGEVYVRRKVACVVSYPVNDLDQIVASEVLLFRHHVIADKFTELDKDQFAQLHCQRDVFYDEIVDGKPLTKIETIKMRLPKVVASVNYDLSSDREFVKLYFK